MGERGLVASVEHENDKIELFVRLAGLLGLERTTLTRNLRPLARDGLVRIDEGDDRRVRRAAITRKGEEAARRAFPFWKKAQDAALASGAEPAPTPS